MSNSSKMSLNVAKGNMYEFVTHTWNPIKGRCYHQCKYCYMNKLLIPKYQCSPVLVESELSKNLNEGKVIFVGSSIDIFAQDIPDKWIIRVLDYCFMSDENRVGDKHIVFLFQSKAPARMLQFIDHPVFKHSIIGTTLESNRNYPEFFGNAPLIEERVEAMETIAGKGLFTMVTAEPLMVFDKSEFVEQIKRCKPRFVNIGRNTERKVLLPEPVPKLVVELDRDLREFTKVKVKSNARIWFV